MVSIAAYCTGLLLARRHLKKFELDEDYPGNETVWKSIGFLHPFIMLFNDCRNARDSRSHGASSRECFQIQK